MIQPTVPEGFAPNERHSPVTDPWEPLYSCAEHESVVLGLMVDAQHCNSRGFLHGGVIASLADNAMGLSVHRASLHRGKPIQRGALTVGLSVDYIATAQIGSWVEIRSRVHELGRSIGVVDCLVVRGRTADERTADDGSQVVARANATFRYRPVEERPLAGLS